MQYLEPNDLAGAYYEATQSARRSWVKYDELERLASNGIRTDLPVGLPKVNDGTLSASTKKIPKRVMAKPMAGTVKALDRDENWVSALVNVIWEQKIIPNATTDATYLRKWKTAVYNSKVYGSQPIYTFFTQHGTYTGADMSLPYVKNVYLEPGKISDLASDYIFMDSYYTKLQMKNLLERAKQQQQEADDNDWDTGGMWDPKVLAAIYDAGPTGDKDAESRNRTERSGQNRNEKGLYKLTTCFNRGYEAPFYTFSSAHANQVAGKQENTNPTGDVPIIYLYHEQDLINPYGTGLIEAAGPTQNVLDNLTQTDVLSTQIGARPPIAIKGDASQVQMRSLVHAPAAFWFTGQAEVQAVNHTNPQFYGQLPARMGLYKGQLQYQTGTFDNSISASTGGDQMFSKTPQGVQQLQQVTNADDNDTLQSIADAYVRVAKSMINIHMNNMEGSELIHLEGDKLERLAATDLIPTDENGEPQLNEIEVIWDNLRGSFDFSVDMNSSMQSNDQTEAQNIKQALETITMPVQYYLGQAGWKFNMGEAYHSLLEKMRLENLDKIITKMTPEEKQEAQKAPFPIVDPPSIRLNGELPQDALQAALQNGGVNYQPSADIPDKPVDLGDIYKDARTPVTVQAQIQKLAGLQPDVEAATVAQAAQDMQHMNAVTPPAAPDVALDQANMSKEA